MGGHLFVVAGDITKLQCDAWLLPTDADFLVEQSFAGAVGLSGKGVLPGHAWDGERLLPFQCDGPQVWLGDIGRTEDTPVEWYVDCVVAFAERAAGTARAKGLDRRPVVALPPVGTRAGGQVGHKGRVIDALVPALAEAAAAHDADVVLVAHGHRTYSAVQRVRSRLTGGTCETWGLSPALDEHARRLADEARRGQLVLFMGAGVSLGVGLPSWTDLLQALASDVGVSFDGIAHLDYRDQAAFLRVAFDNAGKVFHEAVAARVRADRFSLTHALLSSLGCNEAVTTNYDTLYEQAVAGTGDDIAVIPGAALRDADRWLLKLHGTVDQPGTIVLTRRDYREVERLRGALVGLVQGMLMTRHMLFVGYSLSDEDFHELVEEIRDAMGDEGISATSLLLRDNPVFAQLWPGMHAVSVGQPDEDGGRSLRVFLDRVGFLAAQMSAFVLDPTYEEMLNDDERAWRDALADVVELYRSGHPGAELFAELIERLGGER